MTVGVFELKKFIFASLLLLSLSFNARAGCSGEFYDPINDVCWGCIFPVYLSKAALSFFDQPKLQEQPLDVDSCDPKGVTCRCGDTCGIPVSFYEPARHFDVTKQPGCFPGLGLDLDMSGLPGAVSGVQTLTAGKAQPRSFNHVNVYVDPILFWAGIILDFPCLEQKGFDLLYSTPADICWGDEAACQWLNPESFLFGNIASIMACSADCIAETAAFFRDETSEIESWAIDATYWCAGCNGAALPLSGYKEYTPGQALSDTQVMGQRIFQKLHRELLVWGTSGAPGMCGYYPKPIMQKTDYKNSMLYPIAQTERSLLSCCQMFGTSTELWGAGKSFPIKGEDYSFMVFRKRDCCWGMMSAEDLIGATQ